jgi:ATP-dependent DNA ligase
MTKGFTGKTQEEVFDKVKEYYTETLPKKRRDTVRSVIIGLRKGIAENTRDIELPKAGGINLKEGA